jgi:hypothetical protein
MAAMAVCSAMVVTATTAAMAVQLAGSVTVATAAHLFLAAAPVARVAQVG